MIETKHEFATVSPHIGIENCVSSVLSKNKAFCWEIKSATQSNGNIYYIFSRDTTMKNIDQLKVLEKYYNEVCSIIEKQPYYKNGDTLSTKSVFKSITSLLNLILYFPILLLLLIMNAPFINRYYLITLLLISVYFIIRRVTQKRKYNKKLTNLYILLEKIKMKANEL